MEFQKKWNYRQMAFWGICGFNFTIFIDFQLPSSTQRSCCVLWNVRKLCWINSKLFQLLRSLNAGSKGERENVEQRKHWNFIHKSPERTNICFVNAIDGWFLLPKLAQRRQHTAVNCELKYEYAFPPGTFSHFTRISSILCLRQWWKSKKTRIFSLHSVYLLARYRLFTRRRKEIFLQLTCSLHHPRGAWKQI